MRCVLLGLVLLASTSQTASALPPGAPEHLRDGANHHVGDAGFVAAFGRAPTRGDAEHVRMRTHLTWIRARLAAAPATSPALAARRRELLGYLDDYLAKGVTPVNQHLPWRTPVFIDDHGTICAVGYLIERSVGRALPERIAAGHRYDLLEDIAAAMPEVRAWVASSGFTLDELASIQPGYAEPEVESWGNVDYVALAAPDGPYEDRLAGGVTQGTIAKGHMVGSWTRTLDGTLVGKGTFARGAGRWTSFYPDGKKRAEGSYAGDRPHGRWTLYHPSGNLAAVGELRRGVRHGAWQFFHDTEARTPIASGRFGGPGTVVGRWRHYDAAGKLLATTRPVGRGPDPTSRGAFVMAVVPGRDGVVHEISATGGMAAAQLHLVARGRERLYVENHGGIYDADGNQLVLDGAHWMAAPCRWSKRRKAIAAAGDVVTLHRLLSTERAKPCGDPRPVSPARARAIANTLGALAELRAPSPDFVRELVLGRTDVLSELAAVGVPEATDGDDLARLLAASLAWYIEWPHVDGLFVELFPTLAGHALDDEIWAATRARNPTTD